MRVVPVSSDDELVGEVVFNPEDVIELKATSGEYWGGFAEDSAPPPDDKGGAWYWRFWVWAPGIELIRGYGKNEEILEVIEDNNE